MRESRTQLHQCALFLLFSLLIPGCVSPVHLNDAANPSISWNSPTNIAAETALSSAQLNATAGVPGTFTYNPVAGTVLSTGTYTLTVTFTPANTSTYKIATASVNITVTKANPVIAWSAPASIVVGTALGANQLNATANVPGSFVYNPPAGHSTSGRHTVSRRHIHTQRHNGLCSGNSHELDHSDRRDASSNGTSGKRGSEHEHPGDSECIEWRSIRGDDFVCCRRLYRHHSNHGALREPAVNRPGIGSSDGHPLSEFQQSGHLRLQRGLLESWGDSLSRIR